MDNLIRNLIETNNLLKRLIAKETSELEIKKAQNKIVANNINIAKLKEKYMN
jgi:hypothetical protein